MIKVCNNFMEGIDRADENIDKYRTSIRGKKWHSSPLLSVSHWPYKMHGNFIKHVTRSQWIFWRLIGCHYVETQGHPADLCRTGRPQKRHIDSRYDGLSHVTVKQGKQRRCARCQKNALLDITPNSRYLPSPQIQNIILHIMFNVRSGFAECSNFGTPHNSTIKCNIFFSLQILVPHIFLRNTCEFHEQSKKCQPSA